jgi:Cof subfamily protein (haloacid dehalogenase superfamily)
MVASDLDGTLLMSNERVSQRTRLALHALPRGVPFVIATGRPPRWTWDVAEAVGVGGFAVCSNGAVTIDTQTRQVVDTRCFSRAEALVVVDAILSVAPDVQFAVDGLDFFGHEASYIPAWAIPDDVRVAPIRDLAVDNSLKILFRHFEMSDELLTKIVDVVGANGAVTYGATGSVTGRTLIEVMAPGVSKAAALHRIADQHGIAPDEVVAFGDMPNDLEMLAWAGHGVAMANAHLDVLAIANEVTLSNNDHGVAHVLERDFDIA